MIGRDAILAEARSWIGTPYRHQASTKGVGSDCLGLIRGIWRAVYGEEPEAVPAYTPDWAEAAGRDTLFLAARHHLIEIPLEKSVPGDVLFFRLRADLPAKHVAVLSTDDRIIHAYQGTAVVETALSPWWRRRLFHAFSFPGVDD